MGGVLILPHRKFRNHKSDGNNETNINNGSGEAVGRITRNCSEIYQGQKNIPVYKPNDLKKIEKIKPDLVVVNNFRDIIPERYIKKYKTINIHYSLLPKYRGMHAVNLALIND